MREDECVPEVVAYEGNLIVTYNLLKRNIAIHNQVGKYT